MRNYDPRVGRFFSVDPLTSSYPELTPYQFASNTPIVAIDLDGLESWYTNNGEISEIGGPLSKEFREKNKLSSSPPSIVNTNPFINNKPAIKIFNSNNTSAGKKAVDLNDKVPFVSQFSLERPKVACCRACQKTLKDFGLDNSGLKSDRIITAVEAKNKIELTSNAKDGVDYINQQLDSNNPVMVGVDHTLGKGQSDGTASDHYVVITGRNYDKEKKQAYFTFYEVGTKHESKGKSDKNRLYIEKDGSIKGTNYSGKRHFTVIEVRKNKTNKKS